MFLVYPIHTSCVLAGKGLRISHCPTPANESRMTAGPKAIEKCISVLLPSPLSFWQALGGANSRVF